MYEEDSSVFQLPVYELSAAPAVMAEAPVSAISENPVAAAAKVVTTERPAKINDAYMNSDKLSDQALFDELNAVSEEVIKCRDHILSKIS